MVAELVRRTPAGATERSEAIAAHVDFLLNGLHHHHTPRTRTSGRCCSTAPPHRRS
jgi:hypothetical protein